jgi:hypothetical protein
MAAVRCDDVGGAQNDVVGPIWAVAPRIGGTEQSDGSSAKRDREMERTGIPAHDASRVAQESHQGTKRTIVRHRVGIAAAFPDRKGQVIFAGTVVHDTSQAKSVSDQLAELTKAFGRPAL